jgi:hypothetical protein
MSTVAQALRPATTSLNAAQVLSAQESPLDTCRSSTWPSWATPPGTRPPARLARIARDIGFFYLEGHGIAPEQIERLEAVARQFFALPPR